MELVSMVKDVLQNVAEHAVSYRIGQTALRFLDRTLSVVEKCARWAVPPPLDQDERPQPELVRPLPWVFFLCMLIALRVMRESISLANLIMGKPPLRSADVVTYIQSKRRYLRTLKYQGNRIMRARTGSAQPREPWYSSLRSLFEFTMCFRHNSLNYGNNNTTSVSNNDEVLVVKRSKRGREDTSPVTSSSVGSTMERLIEKMMVDLNADSDEDTAYTLTDVISLKNDKPEVTTVSDHDAVVENITPTRKTNSDAHEKSNDEIYFAPPKNCSTPEQNNEHQEEYTEPKKETLEPKKVLSEPKRENHELARESPDRKRVIPEPKKKCNEAIVDDKKDNAPVESATSALKEESLNFIENERCTQKVQRTPKIANGRTVKSVPNKKKGSHIERREQNVTAAARMPSENKSF